MSETSNDKSAPYEHAQLLHAQHASSLEWFDSDAESYEKQLKHDGDPLFQNLHVASGWEYLSRKHYDEMMNSAIVAAPKLPSSNDRVFELGMGSGSALNLFLLHGVTDIAGSDLSAAQVRVASKAFPDHANNFFVHSMTERHNMIRPASYDFVVSFGALGMYLTLDEMETTMVEAVRLVKPGGILIFTHFIEPDAEPKLSIVEPVKMEHWLRNGERLGLGKVQFHSLPHQGKRYTIIATTPTLAAGA